MYVVAINAITRDTNTVTQHRKPIYWNVLQAEDITQTQQNIASKNKVFSVVESTFIRTCQFILTN